MRNVSIKRYAIIACLAAISYLLMFISFAVIPIVPYMKVDFADIPILLGFFVLGVSGGIEIAVLRSVLYFLITGPSIASLIGVGTNLLATLTICLPMYYILHEKHDLKRYIIAIVVSTISLTFWLSLGNWLVITPLYMAVLGMKLTLPLSQLVLYG
ncbi:ECF transporter S component, partial [Bacillus subtilis]